MIAKGNRTMKCQEIRDSFLGFFAERGHLVMPSAPLVLDDPTTLFTVAGMQPYIRAFRGEEQPPAPRVVSNQKCARMNDLELVGRSTMHHTFFEMLGNFSFGDYFKEGAIEFAWEYVTEVLGLPREELWITVFENDDEAEDIWHKRLGVPVERIVRLGRGENWWPEERWEGPCGPCTEIHLDRGPELGCGREDCGPACDCDRFVELWNLVFQMYTEAEDGTLTRLPKPGVDTGMGFERLALILQGKTFSAETDEMWQIMQSTIEVARRDWGVDLSYGEEEKVDLALRVICDHVRAAAMMTADGVAPTNEGAGYVLRRFLRRAYRFGLDLGAQGPFLHKVLPTVAEVMGEAYPELRERQDFGVELVRREEEQFADTLAHGMARLDELIEQVQKKGETEIPGAEAFRLYDTYGLPREMTAEIAGERGLTVDEEGFAAAMEAQRERSRAAVSGLAGHGDASLAASLPASEFCGYDTTAQQATITAIVLGEEQADELSEGAESGVVLEVTPFYAERGGQVGDVGILETMSERREAGDDGGDVGPARFEVTDTQPMGESILHLGRMVRGTLKVGQTVMATVDTDRRDDIRRHHTATHLLHAALRQELGEHVRQSGSLVGPDRLRFDFSHHEMIDAEALARIEDQVNRWIMADLPVEVEYMPLEQATESGAIALFGEKYGETVRTIRVGEVSFELCGGTHCERTGQIGSFRILSESSIAAGARRIEAVTGAAAVRHSRRADEMLAELSRQLNCPVQEMAERVSAQQARIRSLEKDLQAAKQISASVNVPDLVASAQEVGPAKLVVSVVPGADRDMLKALADEVVAGLDSGVAMLGSEADGKVALVCKVAGELINQGAHAGDLVRTVAERAGGGGGGAPHFAQAGGGDPSKLDEALSAAPELLAAQLSQ